MLRWQRFEQSPESNGGLLCALSALRAEEEGKESKKEEAEERALCLCRR